MKCLLVLYLSALFASTTMAQNEQPGAKKWSVPGWDSTYTGKEYFPFSVRGTTGKTFTNESCKGKVTLICFWFESCVGCREEFPQLNELYDSLKNDSSFRFIAITFDDVKSLPEFITKYELHFPIATTNNHDTFAHLNYGMGCPSVVILDKNSRIAFKGIQVLTRNDVPGDFTVSKAIAMIRKLE